jgi:hypothetical protein
MDTAVSQTKRFARYEIIRKLGRSMTDVYLAFDPRIARRIILKLIEESRDDYTQLIIEAEKRGAQIQSELHRLDPRILEIYESGVTQGHFFIAMEFFEGKNLQQILQLERRIDPRRAARYAAEICSQLARLHSFVSDVDGKKRAVVHGDIKPSNIQIGANDELRLLDFGIAKVITSTRNLTQHNLGSPTYCSPERLAKGHVDAQSDLWAVGVTLYEMVAGSPPYQAQDTRKLEQLIESKRPPRSLPPGCPPALASIISKALASDVNRRYGTAAEFEKDLRAFVADKPTGAAHSKQVSWWESNATLQKFRSELFARRPPQEAPRQGGLRAAYDNVTRLVSRAPSRANRTAGGVDWFRYGSILFGIVTIFLLAYLAGRLRNHLWPARTPIDYAHASTQEINNDWAEYQKLKQRDSFLGVLSPARWRVREVKTNLLSAADEVIDEYRNGSDSSPSSVDWAKAQLCLRHALELEPDDRAISGKLALADGYINLIHSPKLPGASRSEVSFRRAASRLPKSPDPHLALARLYVYSYLNIGKALAEFQQAERLNFHFGPRELEEQGDGYLIRAEVELRQAIHSVGNKSEEDKDVRLARSDLDRARNLYEPISGFSNVSVSLNRLDQDESRANELSPPADTEKLNSPVKSSFDPLKKFLSHLKWQ